MLDTSCGLANPRAEMRGRADIAHKIDATVGSATAIHHLFSYEVEITSPTTATGEFAMEDTEFRSDDEPFVPNELPFSRDFLLVRR